ncbi:MAG: FecR domain-containing protein [Opitutaceae bacterium]
MANKPSTSGAGEKPSALDWAERTGLGEALVAELAARALRRRRRWGMASLVVALVVLTGVFWRMPLTVRFGSDAPGRTIVLAPQRQELSDGTIVELRDGTILSHDFSGELRRVTLASGEAHFQVAKNPARPFVVTAAGVNVRAVGTAFTVQVSASAVEVLVTEGRVAVAEKPVPQVVAADSPTSPGTFVDAGHLAVVSGTGVSGRSSSGGTIVTPLAAAAIEDRLGWRVARIEFSATPLAEAITMLNRNSAVQLTLADPSLANLRISGIVRADNTEALVRLLVVNYEVVAEPFEGRGVVLKRR